MKANPARWTLLCGMSLRTSNAACSGERNRKWKRADKRVHEILQPHQENPARGHGSSEQCGRRLFPPNDGLTVSAAAAGRRAGRFHR
ncbi:hypothetical protein VTH06DRAFT_5984 [Thermothelomyces fergusii]